MMINMFNSKTLYLGCDMKKFNEIRDYLDANKVPYKYKVRNHLGGWTGHGTVRGNLGSIGNPSGQMYQYEILVHKDVFDKIKLEQ